MDASIYPRMDSGEEEIVSEDLIVLVCGLMEESPKTSVCALISP
jgi:hypothetical protein